MNSVGCIFLEKGIAFEENKVCDCCISHNDGLGLPVLLDNYNGDVIDWENLFDIKAKRIESQKEKTIYDCEQCYHLSEYTFTNERKISEFHFSQCHICNCKCIYCSQFQNSGVIGYDAYPVIRDLIDKGYYKSGGEATLQGGEPTLMINFDNLVQLLTENGTSIRIHTSAVKYSPKIESALRENMAVVVVSLDSGCSDTYHKIKQIDAFNLVYENLSSYINSAKNKNNVVIKYIIVPGFNDNIQEIDKFFRQMKKLGVTNTALDIEVQYARKYNNKDISKHIFLLVDYFKKEAYKSNINVQIYSFLLYVLRNRNFSYPKWISNKFLYNCYSNLLNDKSKNLKY